MKALAAGTTLLFVLSLLGIPAACQAHELSGYAAVEARLFFHDPLYTGQETSSGSFVFQPEYYHEWENGSSFLFVPFGRVDSTDSERTHFDIRELYYLRPTEDWELRFGAGKVFWGATKFVHLVDIINQTDLVENIDEEDKLGQPMVHLSLPRNWGVWDLFVMPYFRERTFPGREGRPRLTLVVDTDHPIYESSAEEHHVDFAARYSQTVGDLDFGIYHFVGTGREPTLLTGVDSRGRPALISTLRIAILAAVQYSPAAFNIARACERCLDFTITSQGLSVGVRHNVTGFDEQQRKHDVTDAARQPHS